jgi:hypothetical protein
VNGSGHRLVYSGFGEAIWQQVAKLLLRPCMRPVIKNISAMVLRCCLLMAGSGGAVFELFNSTYKVVVQIEPYARIALNAPDRVSLLKTIPSVGGGRKRREGAFLCFVA